MNELGRVENQARLANKQEILVAAKSNCIKQAGSTSKLINESYGSWAVKEKEQQPESFSYICSPAALILWAFLFCFGEAIPVFELLDVPSAV